MDDDNRFAELIRKVRAGDQEAASELVATYEPAIRRIVRLRLDPRLQRVCDSMDICQAVMCSFFLRAASGQYEVETPEQLLKLLAAIARNKVGKAARGQKAARRDIRRVTPGSAVDLAAAAASSPSQQVEAKELLAEAMRLLNPDERKIVELRNQGSDWAGVAAELGGNADALRKKLERALGRVAAKLGIDEADDE